MLAGRAWGKYPWDVEAVISEVWMQRFLALNNAEVYADEVRTGTRTPDGRKAIGTFTPDMLASMPDV